MPGNSRRRGAVRKSGTKKGPTVGSGGQRRRALEGRGPTPPAHMRPNHPAAKRARSQPHRPARRTDETETVLGRNPVLECLRAGVPATALYVALGTEADERLTESVSRAADLGIAILEVPRTDLDRMTANHLHQGIALQVPPYNYVHPDDLIAAATAVAAGAAGRAGQHLRPPQPRCDRAFGRGVWWARRADPAAAFGLGYRGGLAYQRRGGGSDPGGPGHQSHQGT